MSTKKPRGDKSDRPLTPKEARFVEEYLIDLSATQAAIRAGYSVRTARSIGAENLTKPAIQSAVQDALDARSKRTGITADWVLSRLVQDATADLADLYDDTGNLLPVKDWPMVWRTGLVAGVDTVQVRDGQDADGNTVYATVRKLRLLDRTKLVELIGKHVGVGAFRDQVGLSGPRGGPVQVEDQSVERVCVPLDFAAIRAKCEGLSKPDTT